MLLANLTISDHELIEIQKIVDYCSQKEDAYLDFPFGNSPVCFKLEGSIFAELYTMEADYKVTLRCDPEIGVVFRERYPMIVVPGYHVPLRQRRFSNTVLLSSEIEFEALKVMIDHSYDRVRNRKKKNT